jgi:hypothetical protein
MTCLRIAAAFFCLASSYSLAEEHSTATSVGKPVSVACERVSALASEVIVSAITRTSRARLAMLGVGSLDPIANQCQDNCRENYARCMKGCDGAGGCEKQCKTNLEGCLSGCGS